VTEQAWRDRRQVQAEAQAGFRAAFGWRHKLAQCGVSPAPSKKQPGDGQLAFGVFQHLWETGEIRHSGTETCFGGRCVHCSVAASAHYGDCLATAVARNAVRGGSTLMWTINVSHYLPEALADVRARVADLRRYLLGVNECRVLARHLRVDLGLVGWAAVGEVMHGERNGWGPHLHGLLFFDRELTQREMDLFEHRTAVGMVERVADRGWPRVLRERVFKGEPVRDA